ncbi:hypothetical protein TVAG_351880 [Trichomonas vaginalis G3]|uniref:DM10 domain-containing protein n=1 Tax=Trichomonas vaginalis (strain ATCC PRA-98 / G3) TaxID=412133 RepID=A2DZS2_TRIV3|nr:alpha-tubulin binding [Trichomonas vaginalis G3]EAY14140.1 hypothetical protein TVAG_351880 [Trichomonas vaginalis G3]KAI5525150.1 alpha-tubulin binding [Trichomonas vaginalis G3]|eukprot:XP_001326363.1 hypothetical protein [Trichomonas vaginalis G3]
MDLRPPQTVLSFKSHLVSNSREDILRQFIVNYFVDDDKFSVFEKVVPNSGFPGGNFISRAKFINPATGQKYKTEELYIGATVVLNSWTFQLDEATEGTLRAMEANSDQYPKSDLSQTITSKFSLLKGQKAELEQKFKARDKQGRGRVTWVVARSIFDEHDLFTDPQERLTLLRRFQFADVEQFKYNEFLQVF